MSNFEQEKAPKPPVLVTGATGFIGGELVSQLLEDGHKVYGVTRSSFHRHFRNGANLTIVVSDLTKPNNNLTAALNKSEIVYHLAGLNGFGIANPEDFYSINVRGTTNLIVAAKRAGVQKIIYGSSAVTIGEAKGATATEETVRSRRYLSKYEKSKVAAEREAFAYAKRYNIDVISMNPASVQGPGRVSGTAKILLKYLNRQTQLLPNSRVSVVDVQDCATGFILASKFGLPGERYILSGSTQSIQEMLEIAQDVTGCEPGAVKYIDKSLVALAGISEAMAKIRRRPPKHSMEFVRTARYGARYDGTKAHMKLGLRYAPLEETLRRTIQWYSKKGLIHYPLPKLN